MVPAISRSSDWLRPGVGPTQGPTSFNPRNRSGSSIADLNVRATTGPTRAWSPTGGILNPAWPNCEPAFRAQPVRSAEPSVCEESVRPTRSEISILMLVSAIDFREVSSARISRDDTALQCAGRNQPIRSSRAMPSVSRRSVLIGIAFIADLTCRVSSSTASKPALVNPLCSHWDSGSASRPIATIPYGRFCVSEAASTVPYFSILLRMESGPRTWSTGNAIDRNQSPDCP